MLIYTLLASDEGFDRAVCRLAKKLRLDAIDPNRCGVVGIVLLGFIASFTLMPCSAGLYVTFNIITKECRIRSLVASSMSLHSILCFATDYNSCCSNWIDKDKHLIQICAV